MNACKHILGDGSTLVIASDGCSLKCTACQEIVLPVERVSFICTVKLDPKDPYIMELVEGGWEKVQ